MRADAVALEHLLRVAVIGGHKAQSTGLVDTRDGATEGRIRSLDRCDDCGNRARMANHVGIREVHDCERVPVADLVAESISDTGRRHLGLQVVARDVARRGYEDPALARPLALL